jgi:hypothetical protein
MNGNKLLWITSTKNEDCSCMIPYRLHTMPSKESMRLQWANTLNRKSLPKQVFACSEHFLDGKPTERNPIPVILFLHLQDIKWNTFQKLSVSLMFLNRQVLAPGHNTNIQTVLGKDDHTYAKPWSVCYNSPMFFFKYVYCIAFYINCQ